MSSEQVLLVAAGVVALVALLLALRAHRRALRAEAAAAALVRRLDLLESPVTDLPAASRGADAGAPATFVITSLDDAAPPTDQPPAGAPAQAQVPLARPIDGRLFADIVARETVVTAASWGHGVRRALSPESRNRIRFHVRQETRRAGRERRAEMKQALREFRAREREAARAPLGEDVA